eukprot:909728-Amphidinium_carterae.2
MACPFMTIARSLSVAGAGRAGEVLGWPRQLPWETCSCYDAWPSNPQCWLKHTGCIPPCVSQKWYWDRVARTRLNSGYSSDVQFNAVELHLMVANVLARCNVVPWTRIVPFFDRFIGSPCTVVFTWIMTHCQALLSVAEVEGYLASCCTFSKRHLKPLDIDARGATEVLQVYHWSLRDRASVPQKEASSILDNATSQTVSEHCGQRAPAWTGQKRKKPEGMIMPGKDFKQLFTLAYPDNSVGLPIASVSQLTSLWTPAEWMQTLAQWAREQGLTHVAPLLRVKRANRRAGSLRIVACGACGACMQRRKVVLTRPCGASGSSALRAQEARLHRGLHPSSDTLQGWSSHAPLNPSRMAESCEVLVA